MDDALYRAALIVFHRELGLPLIEAGRFASAIVVWSAETPKARAVALEIHGPAIRASDTGRSEAKASKPGVVLRNLSPEEAHARAEALADAQRRERDATAVAARRFGSGHAKPCAHGSVWSCSMWECQILNRCKDLPAALHPPAGQGENRDG